MEYPHQSGDVTVLGPEVFIDQDHAVISYQGENYYLAPSNKRRFRKKPVEVEARRWDGTADGATALIEWILSQGSTARYECSDPIRCSEHDGDTPHCIAIVTLEGTMSAGLGDWIIQGLKGEFYPCKPDIFAETYEAVE